MALARGKNGARYVFCPYKPAAFGEQKRSSTQSGADSKLKQNLGGARPLPLAPLAGARTRPRFRDWTRARGAKIARRIPISWQEPGRIGARKWDRADSAACRFQELGKLGLLCDFGTESKALQLPRFQRFERSSRIKIADRFQLCGKSQTESGVSAG